ncbi:hypothetical protein HKX48_006365 [Thoreauomyces humboldtii]|nr:hypothetical protein HKX48_006365 [Thoreauomyces humboldtii]
MTTEPQDILPRMQSELEELRAVELAQFTKSIRDDFHEKLYRPGGPGYLMAANHFGFLQRQGEPEEHKEDMLAAGDWGLDLNLPTTLDLKALRFVAHSLSFERHVVHQT